VIPAAADEISALQAAIFAAYGGLYQSVNAQAMSIHELFVHTLGGSADSYAATESANSGATASRLSAVMSSLVGPAASADPPGGNLAEIVNIGTGNWDSAASDLLGMCGGGILPGVNETGATADAAGAAAGSDGTVLTGTGTPATAAGFGALPPVGALGQVSPIARLSVPPSWAAGAVPAASPDAVTAGWTVPVPQSTSATTVAAGMPMAAPSAMAGKAGGLGAPRYGVKPTVMGQPTVA
jgi:hypothetical protein